MGKSILGPLATYDVPTSAVDRPVYWLLSYTGPISIWTSIILATAVTIRGVSVSFPVTGGQPSAGTFTVGFQLSGVTQTSEVFTSSGALAYTRALSSPLVVPVGTRFGCVFSTNGSFAPNGTPDPLLFLEVE